MLTERKAVCARQEIFENSSIHSAQFDYDPKITLNFKFSKKNKMRLERQLAQWLKTLAALPKNLTSSGGSQRTVTPVLGDETPSSGLLEYSHTCGIHIK